jgi:hypothetical protein
MPLDKALPIATDRRGARGATGVGIINRDLKPTNNNGRLDGSSRRSTFAEDYSPRRNGACGPNLW